VNFWKVILASVVIFGAGVLAGSLLIKFSESNQPVAVPSVASSTHPSVNEHDPLRDVDFPKPRPPEMLSKQFLKQLDGCLKLTPEQHDAIQKIITDGQEKNRRLWTNIAPEMRQVMLDVRQNIKDQLTAEQWKQFEDLIKRSQHKPAATTNAPAAAVTIKTNAP